MPNWIEGRAAPFQGIESMNIDLSDTSATLDSPNHSLVIHLFQQAQVDFTQALDRISQTQKAPT
jgi:hypothetical protein